MRVCNHCGDCIAGCPEGALSLDDNGKVQWNSGLCAQCDKCLDICPISASPKTSSYGVADLVEIIRENQPFISGVTLSGGEATAQLPFIIDLLTTLRADSELKKLPNIDGVMLDLKAWHSVCHKMLTGADNSKVKLSLSLLAAANKLLEVRLLVIPDQTDYLDNLNALCRMLRELPGETTVRINAFHHHGVRGNAKSWLNATRLQVETFAQQLESAGITNLVLPSVYLENL